MSEIKYYMACKNKEDELEVFAPYTNKDRLKGLVLSGTYLTKKMEEDFIPVNPEKVSMNTYKSLVSEEVFEKSGDLTKEEKNMEWEIFLANLHKLKTRKQKLNEVVNLKYYPLEKLLNRKLEKEVYLIQASV